MSRKYWPAVRSVIEGDLPEPSEISKVDQEMIRRLLNSMMTHCSPHENSRRHWTTYTDPSFAVTDL